MTNDGDWRPKKKLGRKTLKQVATIAAPETLLTWHRNRIGRKHAGSRRQPRGRTPTRPEIAALAVRMAEENGSWGYRRVESERGGLGKGGELRGGAMT